MKQHIEIFILMGGFVPTATIRLLVNTDSTFKSNHYDKY